MSEGGDNVLARWSRRKLATRHEEAATPVSPVMASDAAEAPVPVTDRSETDEAEQIEAEIVASLPRLEDLTAESDISAFLQKGVPKAIKQAALRRIWSLDTGIRDYIGPSENAWDFNNPDAMPGFGLLDAKERVVDFLSDVTRAIESITKPDDGDADDSRQPHESDEPALTIAQVDKSQVEQSEPETLEVPLTTTAKTVADERTHVTPALEKQPRQLRAPVSRSRHGGALPR